MKRTTIRLFAIMAGLAVWTGSAASGTEESGWTNLLDADLSSWEVWTGVPHPTIKEFPDGYALGENPAQAPAIGLRDPYHVYTTERDSDGEWVMKVSGRIHAGLTSKASYSNYHLTLQVKWGEARFEPRLDKKRDSGVIYHATGPHGVMWKIWKRSLELQIQEGDFGDLYLLGGPTAMVQAGADLVWNPQAPATRQKAKAVRSVDAESPPGQWTRIDLYVLGSSAVHVINGRVVMAHTDANIDGVPLTAGQLQIQSEGAEVYYRDIRIRSIDALPAAIARQCGGLK